MLKVESEYSIFGAQYQVEMPDGSKWEVPVAIIALDRARYYAHEFQDVIESLNKDTLPLFQDSWGEIEDWARNNMDWGEVSMNAVCVEQPSKINYQDGWVDGEIQIVETDVENG